MTKRELARLAMRTEPEAAAAIGGSQLAPAQQLLLDLQRSAGNRATSELLQRHFPSNQQPVGRSLGGASLQRQGSDGRGSVVKSAPQSQGASTMGEAGPPLAKDTRAAFLDDRDIFINLWLTAGIAALAGAPEAKDKESTANWWVALAGNLLWAATCLVNPGSVLVIRLMSFVGAGVGSGVLAQDPETAPSGRETVSQRLTQGRDLLVQTSDLLIDRAVAECGEQQITDPEERRKVLWRHLFSTPYNQSEPMRAEMSGKIKVALSQFLVQWHTWNDKLKEEAEERGYTGGLSPDVYAMPDVVAEYAKDPTKAWMLEQDPVTRVNKLRLSLMKKKPFTPHISF